MEKIKFKVIVMILFSLSLFVSCNKSSSGLSYQFDHLLSKGYFKMEVSDQRGLDGCTFLLKQNNKFYEPVNLDKKYFVNGKQLYVKYLILNDRASICMSGEIIQIVDIVEAEK